MLADGGKLAGRLFFLVLLLAMILRFYGLDRLGLWADELWVVMDSRQGSLLDMLRIVYYQDNHPPGYYLLSRYTQAWFGVSDFAIRLPSAVAGILLVAVTFASGRKFFSLEAALIAATLVAGSYQAIYYSQEARANIFIALFSLLSLHYFRALVLEGEESRKNLVAFWLFATLNAYFHYAGLVFTASLFFIYLFMLGARHNQAFLVSGVKIFFPVLLLYLPWLPGMYHDLVASPPESWQYNPTAQTLANTFIFLFGPGDIRVYGYGLVLAGLPLWIAAVACIKPWRDRYAHSARIAALLWVCMVLPVVFFYLKSIYSQSAYNRRHFLYAIPLLALLGGALLAQGLALFPEKNRPKILVAMIALIIGYQGWINDHYALYRSNHFKQDYRESAQWVITHKAANPHRHILIASNAIYFNHYLDYFSDGHAPAAFLLNEESQLHSLQQKLMDEEQEGFYYLEAPAFPAANKMLTPMDQLLAEQFQVVCRTKFTRTQVILFENKKSLPDAVVDWEKIPACPTEK